MAGLSANAEAPSGARQGGVEPPSLARKVTIAIKTFRRPHHLKRLLCSIRTHYPALEILVADDSEEPAAPGYPGVRTLELPPNAGLSAGRNALLRHIRTRYFVLCDDDFVFERRTCLEELLSAAERFSLDIVAGEVIERGRPIGWSAFLTVQRDALVTSGVARGYAGSLPLYDVVPNFFLGRTERVRAVGWDDRLKLGEHTDFFLRAKQAGLVCGLHPRVRVGHRPEPDDPRYRNNHKQRHREGQAIWMQDWGVRRRSAAVRRRGPRPVIFTGATGRCGTHFLMGMAYRLLPDFIVRGEQDPDLFGVRDRARTYRGLRRIASLARTGEGFLKSSYSFALFWAPRALAFFRPPEFRPKMVHLARDPLETAISFGQGKAAAPNADSRGRKYFLLPGEARFFGWRAQWSQLERNLWHWFETQARILELRESLGPDRVFDLPFHRLDDEALWKSFCDFSEAQRHACSLSERSARPLLPTEVWRNASPRPPLADPARQQRAAGWLCSLPSAERRRAERILETLLELGLLAAPPVFA